MLSRITSLEYSLTVIEDQETPLTSTMDAGNHLILITGIVVVIVAIGILVSIYLIRSNSYQSRIKALCEEHKIDIGEYYLGRRLSRLKESLGDIEQLILEKEL